MLSRVSDSLYWMSRYLERAEHNARLIGVNLDLSLELATAFQSERWARPLAAMNVSLTPEEAAELDTMMAALLYDASRPMSVRACVNAARENARQVREQVSTEMWQDLNRLYLRLRGASKLNPDEHGNFCRDVIEGAHLFQGLTDATLNHGEGWQFIQIGRYLERAMATSRLLDVYFASYMADGAALGAVEYIEQVGLLKSCTAFEGYCKVYTADFQPRHIAEFLLLNEEFPRSVRFAVDSVQAALEAIARDVGARKAGRAERLAGRLRATLDFGHVDEIMADSLHDYLGDVMQQCERIHAAMYETYIAYTVDSALAS